MAANPQNVQPSKEEPSANQSPTPSNVEEPVHIAEELDNLDKDSRMHTLMVVGAVLLVIAAVLAALSYMTRPKPKASGTLDEAYAVALQGDNVLVTVKVNFENIGGKPLWIKDIKAQFTGADGREYTDTAANALDFDRYFRGFPDLRDHSIQPLKVETKVAPGEQVRGSVIFSLPVTLDAFNNRKSLAVIVTPYASFMAPNASEEPPVIITKQGK